MRRWSSTTTSNSDVSPTASTPAVSRSGRQKPTHSSRWFNWRPVTPWLKASAGARSRHIKPFADVISGATTTPVCFMRRRSQSKRCLLTSPAGQAAQRRTMSVVSYGDSLEPEYEQPHHWGARGPRRGRRGNHQVLPAPGVGGRAAEALWSHPAVWRRGRRATALREVRSKPWVQLGRSGRAAAARRRRSVQRGQLLGRGQTCRHSPKACGSVPHGSSAFRLGRSLPCRTRQGFLPADRGVSRGRLSSSHSHIRPPGT